MDVDREIAAHYSRGDLEKTILDALVAGGRDIENLRTSDLSSGDEFHFGWRAATIDFADHLDFPSGAHLIDLGSGIGGPARYFAETHGCRVSGVDLTDDFVRTANALTRRCGLADRASFQQASALALPFGDGVFDGAIMLHVAMNIEDKAKLFSEARRVLKPGVRFGVYDVMRIGAGDLAYPMPWATTAATSFVETPAAYRRLLTEAGFSIESETDRGEFSLRLGRELREKAERDGAPPFNLHTLMGPATPQRISNVTGALERGDIAPIEMIARAI